VPDIFWIDGNPRPDHPTSKDLFAGTPANHPTNKDLFAGTPGSLAIVTRPQGSKWLGDEMLALKRGGIETLVSLLERREAEWLGLEDERAAAEKAGLTFLNFPITDTTVPLNVGRFRAFVSDLAARLRRGEHIGVHCRGSIGRATVTAACALIHLGWRPADALAAVEQTRGCSVPDTEEQRAWILAYEARL
jgi:protein-tyrosine phosphatase